MGTTGKTRRGARLLRTVFLVAAFLAGILLCRTAFGAEGEDDLFSVIDISWGGYLRAIGTATWVDDNTVYAPAGDDPFYDGQLEARLKSQVDFGPRWRLETHYELVALGGDTYEAARVPNGLPANLAGLLAPTQAVDDARRLMDLTRILSEQDDGLAYHRLDRLNLTHTADWGTLRLGRQALTWGDGLIFNPMDLFNPFSPTAVQRDYKVGDDMAYLQLPLDAAELQLLYLPRRDPVSGDPAEDQASYAAKYHAPVGSLEMDAMAARHYGDGVAGLGASGYWGGAAWRINAIYTYLEDGDGRNDFFQTVANLDYAWVWGGKNFYGLVEFFYNGLGYTGDYEKALFDADLVERLARGELFTIGRYYLSGRVQVELHPLVQLFTTAIVNLSDPSGLIQPQVQWDVAEDVQAIAGAQWHWGGSGSEFGGYDVATAAGDITIAPSDRIYFWLTYYF